jgi:hypothetical protein
MNFGLEIGFLYTQVRDLLPQPVAFLGIGNLPLPPLKLSAQAGVRDLFEVLGIGWAWLCSSSAV